MSNQKTFNVEDVAQFATLITMDIAHRNVAIQTGVWSHYQKWDDSLCSAETDARRWFQSVLKRSLEDVKSTHSAEHVH